MVKIPKKVSERLKKEIAPFQKILTTAKDRDVNKFDTATIVVDMLANIFGYDKFNEITSEQANRGTYCDLAVKSENNIQFLIEVNAIGQTLKDNHLRQAIEFGATHGVPWIVLTNGVDWEVYKIRSEKPVNCDLISAMVFTDINQRKQEDLDKIFLLCTEGIEKAAIDAFHDHKQSANRFVIGALVQSDAVVATIRRELRKLVVGIKVTEEEIQTILNLEVLKRDIVQGKNAEEANKRIKEHKKQVQPKNKAKAIPRAKVQSKIQTKPESEPVALLEANKASEPEAPVEAQTEAWNINEPAPDKVSTEKPFEPEETSEFELPVIDLDEERKTRSIKTISKGLRRWRERFM